ncbi:calcium-binding protein [Thiorhodospira sibirica]|uniref:calcium-binding protein n=1 Tax=Thiorhodospira sibirica TaxID=154347 RepID=UPI001111A7C7|nr:calcium-binding protein [Thiorhodospira sibirica]
MLDIVSHKSMKNQFYVPGIVKHIIIPDNEYVFLHPIPMENYHDLEITLGGPSARVEMSSAIARIAKITLSSEGIYQYSFNSDTGRIEVKNAFEEIVVTLPVDKDGMSSWIRVGETEYSQIQVNPQTFELTGSLLESAIETNPLFELVEPGILKINNESFNHAQIKLQWSDESLSSTAILTYPGIADEKDYRFDFSAHPLEKISLFGLNFDLVASPDDMSGIAVDSTHWSAAIRLDGESNSFADLSKIKTDINMLGASFAEGFILPDKNGYYDEDDDEYYEFYWFMHPDQADGLEVSGAGRIELEGYATKLIDLSKINSHLSLDRALFVEGVIYPSSFNGYVVTEDWYEYLGIELRPDQAHGLEIQGENSYIDILGNADRRIDLSNVAINIYADEITSEVIFPVTHAEQLLSIHAIQLENPSLYNTESKGFIDISGVNADTVFPQNIDLLNIRAINFDFNFEGVIDLSHLNDLVKRVWARDTHKDIEIITGEGSQSIYAGLGKSILTGGEGNDVFKFNANHGEDSVITDFLQGDNQLEILFNAWDFWSWRLIAQDELRGNGSVYQVVDVGGTLNENTGLAVLQTSQAELSVESALAVANQFANVNPGDYFYLLMSDAENSTLFIVADSTNDGIIDSSVKMVTLAGVMNASENLSDSHFIGFNGI